MATMSSKKPDPPYIPTTFSLAFLDSSKQQLKTGLADQQCCLHETDKESVPLFEKIRIVLLGYHEAGKNTIGNTILRKKAFTHWNNKTGHYSKADSTIFGRRVSLVRVPGWSEDLSCENVKQEKLRQVIKDSMMSFKDGPQVIILVVKMNNTLTYTTRKTLEKLLDASLSKHTLVFSTDGEKVSFAEITEHSESNKRTVINVCRKRYRLFKRCACGKQNMELIESIEEFIARKDDIHFYAGKEAPNPKSQIKHLDALVEKLDQRISVLSQSISKLQADNKMETDEFKRKIELNNDKIKKLQDILREKQSAIQMLKCSSSNLGNTNVSIVENTESQTEDDESQNKMKHQRKTWKKKLKKKREETLIYRPHLEGIKVLQIQTNTTWNRMKQDEEGLFATESDEEEDAQPSEFIESFQGHYQEVTSECLHGWTQNLIDVLEELSEEQFKKMKFLLQNPGKWRIAAGLLEDKDRTFIATLLIQKWGEHQCIINTRNIMKDIPRNDKIIQDLFKPFLEYIGETW
ncbi:uncharacterized protein [Hoplias malabaricus]|uniref:uncharacterized protein n=1 Tax=Hoplias malabaricus TaxID=27720 RepID=UPI0034623049